MDWLGFGIWAFFHFLMFKGQDLVRDWDSFHIVYSFLNRILFLSMTESHLHRVLNFRDWRGFLRLYLRLKLLLNLFQL